MTAGKIKTLIVDDEPIARRGVRLLLDRDSEIEIIGECTQGLEAVDCIFEQKPDLVFLDVQMPELDGFQVIEKVGTEKMPAVVFVTAYDEHALRAFDVNAVDYLLKPYDDARFTASLERAKKQVRNKEGDTINARLTKLLQFFQESSPGPSAELAKSDRILLKSSGEIFFLKPEEIDWIEAEGDYMKFYVAGRTHLLRETMARLEERLDARRFIRIHRSTIVNIDRVKKLSPTFAGEYAVVLHDGTKLRLSRGYQERVQTLLKGSF